MANVQKISINGTSYNCTDTTKALKTEAIKNITRSGTTFTATRCNGTTFTFTQQDNNTTTGTSYGASSIPNNNTFGTNSTIKNVRQESINRITPSVVGTITSINGNVTLDSNVGYYVINVNLTISGGTVLAWSGIIDASLLTANRIYRIASGYANEIDSAQLAFNNSTKKLTLNDVYINTTSYTSGIFIQVMHSN